MSSGGLQRKLSSASSLGSMEESYFLQASLDSSDKSSEKRSMPEATMSPYYMKSITPSAYEATLRQKEGELASYMSRLVGVKSIQLVHFCVAPLVGFWKLALKWELGSHQFVISDPTVISEPTLDRLKWRTMDAGKLPLFYKLV